MKTVTIFTMSTLNLNGFYDYSYDFNEIVFCSNSIS